MVAVVGVCQKSVSLHPFMFDHSTVKDGVAEELLSSALRLNVYKCVGAWMGDLYGGNAQCCRRLFYLSLNKPEPLSR